MTIVSTYSSWTRARLTPEVKARIREAGDGRLWFGPALGRPLGWVGCTVVVDGSRASAEGADPGAAFDAALALARTQIVSVLG